MAKRERVFSSLEAVWGRRKVYRTRDQSKADVFDYVERFYTPKRLHGTIGFGSKRASASDSSPSPILQRSVLERHCAKIGFSVIYRKYSNEEWGDARNVRHLHHERPVSEIR